jgi:hypothetical protein
MPLWHVQIPVDTMASNREDSVIYACRVTTAQIYLPFTTPKSQLAESHIRTDIAQSWFSKKVVSLPDEFYDEKGLSRLK